LKDKYDPDNVFALNQKHSAERDAGVAPRAWRKYSSEVVPRRLESQPPCIASMFFMMTAPVSCSASVGLNCRISLPGSFATGM
jgi:hypothetical protein